VSEKARNQKGLTAFAEWQKKAYDRVAPAISLYKNLKNTKTGITACS
jgi:hypothetical protein